jgi:hypothetical protein
VSDEVGPVVEGKMSDEGQKTRQTQHDCEKKGKLYTYKKTHKSKRAERTTKTIRNLLSNEKVARKSSFNYTQTGEKAVNNVEECMLCLAVSNGFHTSGLGAKGDRYCLAFVRLSCRYVSFCSWGAPLFSATCLNHLMVAIL